MGELKIPGGLASDLTFFLRYNGWCPTLKGSLLGFTVGLMLSSHNLNGILEQLSHASYFYWKDLCHQLHKACQHRSANTQWTPA